MASYLVLTPPGAAFNDDKARFIVDRFSWLAFLFPAIWLLAQRQWLAGIAVAMLQIVVTIASSVPDALLASVLVEIALRLLIALEGPAFVARRLESGGWTLRSIIVADRLTTAEMIYDQADEPAGAAAGREPGRQNAPATTGPAAPNAMRPAFGLFGTYGER